MAERVPERVERVPDPDSERQAEREPDRESDPEPGLSRRGILVAGGTAAGIVALTTGGQTLTPLHDLALLAPRRPDDGPQGVPIDRTAAAAGVRGTAIDPAQADRALPALFINGRRLSVDHGYPPRLIASDRPGVLQTTWLRQGELR